MLTEVLNLFSSVCENILTGMKQSRIQSLCLTNVRVNQQVQAGAHKTRVYFVCKKLRLYDVQSRGLCACLHCRGYSTCIVCAAWLRALSGCIGAMKGFLGRASSPKRLNRDFAIVSTTLITGVCGSVYSFMVYVFFPRNISVFFLLCRHSLRWLIHVPSNGIRGVSKYFQPALMLQV